MSPVAEDLVARWRAEWPRALAAWSAYTQLREPRFLETAEEAAEAGMAGDLAAIRLRDQTILVNLVEIRARGLEDLALQILAHEVGHHVYVPGNLSDDARLFLAMRPMLHGLEDAVVHVATNLYADLLINDRLKRRSGIDMAEVYRTLRAGAPAEASSRVWTLYSRVYEHLWSLAPGTLVTAAPDEELDADAALLARLVRHYAGEWLRGGRRFAAILYPYFAKDAQDRKAQALRALGLHDTRGARRPLGGEPEGEVIPPGLSGIDPTELEDPEADAEFDAAVAGPRQDGKPRREPAAGGVPAGQHRTPFEYGQVLQALGLTLSDHAVVTRYYRERALPYLIPFPARRASRVMEPELEGYEPWEPTDALEELDPLGTVLRSPVVVAGVTTLRRTYGESPGPEPAPTPMDLDIYVDSSGSMPNPGVNVSYLALGGTILALSALRAGARVQATLWSGAGQFETTGGFVRDEGHVLGVITGYLGDGTAFPLHQLRDTWAQRKADDPPGHVVVISDDGADTMLEEDERGTQGERICREALEKARGGGTLVLNLPGSWAPGPRLEKLGYRVHTVTSWEDLVAFAAAFVRETYGEGARGGAPA